MTKKTMGTRNLLGALSRRTYVLAILMSVALVGCSPKQYNYECLDGFYKVSIDDTKEVLDVSWEDNVVYKVPLYSVNKRANGTTVYSYYYSFASTNRFFKFHEPDKKMFVGGLECTKV